MNPTLRKPLGVLLIVTGLAIYAVAVAALSGWIGQLPVLVQAPLYLVLGLVWIAPLRPMLLWMETGRWRAR